MTFIAGSLTVGGIAAAFVATLINQDSTGLYIICAVIAAAGLAPDAAARRQVERWVERRDLGPVVRPDAHGHRRRTPRHRRRRSHLWSRLHRLGNSSGRRNPRRPRHPKLAHPNTNVETLVTRRHQILESCVEIAQYASPCTANQPRDRRCCRCAAYARHPPGARNSPSAEPVHHPTSYLSSVALEESCAAHRLASGQSPSSPRS